MIRQKDGFSGERSFVLPPSCVSMLEEHPLSSTLHITDIGYYPHAEGHYRERHAPIGEHVLIYCKAGKGWYEAKGRRYDVSPDTYFILPAGEPHRYGASEDDPWSIYWVHFKGSIASEYLPPDGAPRSIKPGLTSRISARLEMFDELMSVLDRGFSLENLLYACSLFHHFLGSMRFLRQFRGEVSDSGSENDIITAAIKYMNENLDRPLRLEEIARYAGYSKSQFSHLFSASTGQSPMTYANQLRINKACAMLEFTSLKINQICFRVGVTDPYYFSRLFTRVMGVSPAEYRRSRNS